MSSTCKAGVIPQSLQLKVQVMLSSQKDITIGESARSCMRLDQCVRGGGASIGLLT
jgi:hypothetical protein